MWGTGSISEKMQALYVKLIERVEKELPLLIMEQPIFYTIYR